MPHAEPVPIARRARLKRSIRFSLVIMALVFLGVMITAAWLHPYGPDGAPRSMATHTQLGLPPCSMVVMFGKPCPSCGMTTAFSLLMHGDVRHSLQANWVGTLLALTWLALIPWGIVSALRGRYWGVRSVEWPITLLVGTLLLLMLARWAAVMWL